jgi:hypothetical protein
VAATLVATHESTAGGHAPPPRVKVADRISAVRRTT